MLSLKYADDLDCSHKGNIDQHEKIWKTVLYEDLITALLPIRPFMLVHNF